MVERSPPILKEYNLDTFKFVGSKAKLIPEIKKYIPNDVTVIVEPFCGSASLSFDLELPFYISDSSPELINFFKVISNKSKLSRLFDTLDVHQKVSNEEHYYIIRGEDRLKSFSLMSDIQRAARYYYILRTGFNGLYRVNTKGYCNTPFGKRDFNYSIKHLVKMNEYMVKYCKGIEEKQFDNHELLISLIDSGETPFVFIDSPYFPADDGKKVYTEYTAEGIRGDFKDRYVRFIEDLGEAEISFLATNTWCNFINESFSNFNVDKKAIKYTIAADGTKRGEKFEAFISNKGEIDDNISKSEI